MTCQQAWTHPEITGIGAGIDSYEYALKWYSGKHLLSHCKACTVIEVLFEWNRVFIWLG